MRDFFCSPDFGIGLVSGILSGFLVSIFIWSLRYFSKKTGILRPTNFHNNPERIRITNTGKIDVEGFDVFGQVSFSENGNRKRYHIKLDGMFNCPSPTILPPSESRTFTVDLTNCIPNHNFNTFQQFKNQFPLGRLIIHVRYTGKYTGTLKKITEEFLELGV
jgi:hypothetical protein